jgi:ABC-type polysaccharide/polyol phosphate export permease
VVFSELGGNGDWRDYAPFLLVGMCVWEFLRNSVVFCASAFMTNDAYIRQCPLPYSIYTLRTVCGTGIHFLIGLLVVTVLLIILRGSAAPLLALGPILPAILFAGIFAWGIGTMIAYFTVYFRDIKHLLEVGSQVAFFLTPIVYSRDILDKKGIGFVADLNPANTFIELFREPLLNGVVPGMNLYLQGFGLAAAALLLGAGTTAWLQKRVIFHL